MGKDIREEVREYYGGIAKKVSEHEGRPCGCGASCCCPESGLYPADILEGLPKEAVEASLGCANPVALADLQKGEMVLDLGSGGGIDVLLSAGYVGETGKVYGLDMTDSMLELADRNKEKAGVKNVEFIKGYIEAIPLERETVDVVTSNCVINLSESKGEALREAYRVLKKGGRLAIADIVQLKEIPDEIRNNIQIWVCCIAGALKIGEYERILKDAGFTEIEITPVNLYTKESIRELAAEKGQEKLLDHLDMDSADAVFAGAHVRARK